MLEGEFEFSSGEGPIRVGAGSLLDVPKGSLHAHENVGEGVGRMLVSQTPGGLYELFVEEVGRPVDGEGGLPDFEDPSEVGSIEEVPAKCRIEIAPPKGVGGWEDKKRSLRMCGAGMLVCHRASDRKGTLHDRI